MSDTAWVDPNVCQSCGHYWDTPNHYYGCPEIQELQKSAWEICWACKGSGLHYTGEALNSCSECHGMQSVRKRDSKGRFIRD